jgi:Leucine-rich repeat (LRR) protein
MTSFRPSSSSGRPMTGYGVNLVEEPTKSVFEDVISEEYLYRLYPGQNLKEFQTISLIIDTSYQSLLDLGDLLPNLTKLILDHSKLSSVRDLGTGLRSLTSVSLNNCGLSEIDGIGMLSHLQSLQVRDNQITDINPMAMHETIEVHIHCILPFTIITGTRPLWKQNHRYFDRRYFVIMSEPEKINSHQQSHR